MLAPMLLPQSAAAWATPDFETIFKAELTAHAESLPLQAALAHSSHALPERLHVRVLRVETAANGAAHIKAGLHFAGITPGCACADDPTPLEEATEYCEVWVTLDPADGTAGVTLID